MYYVSADGDVYSLYSHKLLKHNIDLNGYHRVDIHERHYKVHKLVWLTWKGPIPYGLQINHRDDNKDNNNISNLYLGTQKENINDCIKNNHRKGNLYKLVVYDKLNGQVETFEPACKIFNYSGHTSANGGVTRAMTRLWFQERFTIISYDNV